MCKSTEHCQLSPWSPGARIQGLHLPRDAQPITCSRAVYLNTSLPHTTYLMHVHSHATSTVCTSCAATHHLTHSPTHPYPHTHIILYQTQVTLRPNEGGGLLISVHHAEPVKMSLACATQGNVKVRCSETKIS